MWLVELRRRLRVQQRLDSVHHVPNELQLARHRDDAVAIRPAIRRRSMSALQSRPHSRSNDHLLLHSNRFSSPAWQRLLQYPTVSAARKK
jgi:hypothetical protein